MCDLSYFGITTFLLKSSKNKQKEAGDGQNLKNYLTSLKCPHNIFWVGETSAWQQN